MTTITELLIPNLEMCCNNTEIIRKKIWAEEQKSRILKELYKIAEKELREDDKSKKECLRHLKEWIKQNPDIENCLTDDGFLLRFLRVKKFSIPMAEQTLLKYLNFKKRFQNMLFELDYTDSKVSELFSLGYIYVSPFRDPCGRRVIIYDTTKFDVQKFNGIDLAKCHAITYETLIDDDENQILGASHIGDLSGLHSGYLTLFTLSEFAYLIRWGEQSFPMRHKEINLINLPKIAKYAFDFAKSNMSQKLRDRIKVHESKESLYENIEKRCLPAEMGGEMPAKYMIKMWKEELAAKRERLLSFDAINLLSDRGIISRRSRPSADNMGVESLPGSFRKLELD